LLKVDGNAPASLRLCAGPVDVKIRVRSLACARKPGFSAFFTCS
jgi:hypothetical protein